MERSKWRASKLKKKKKQKKKNSTKNSKKKKKKKIKTKELKYFPTLKAYKADADTTSFVNFVENLDDEFKTRFTVFESCDNMLLLVKNPFVVEATDPWFVQAQEFFPGLPALNLQTQLIEIQSDDELRQLHKMHSAEEFWLLHVPQTRAEMKNMALKVLCMFGSTYGCESSFSNMNFIKNNTPNK